MIIVRNGEQWQWAGGHGTAAAWSRNELVRLERYGRLHHLGGGGTTRLQELRLLIHAILGYQRNEFRDDATIMVLERRPSRPTGLAGRRWCSGATGVPAVTGGSPSRAVQHAVLWGARRLWHDLRFKDLYRAGKEFELMQRALGFAALALLTVIPLLILIAAASPTPQHGLAGWVIYGMGLNGSSADAVTRLFSAPARVLGTTSIFSAVLLAVAGISFAGSVQAGFERIWGLPAGPWHKIWRQAVWATGLVAYIYAAATVGTATHGGLAETAGRLAVAVVLGIAFFWWGLRFLVGGRVSYLAAMPGAAATLVGLGGLRVFSGLVFEPLIVRNAVSYGALGTVLIVQSWLIGVGFVLYGGQLVGRWFHDAWLRPWADNRSGQENSGQEKEGEQDPGSQNTPPGQP